MAETKSPRVPTHSPERGTVRLPAVLAVAEGDHRRIARDFVLDGATVTLARDDGVSCNGPTGEVARYLLDPRAG